MLATFIQHLHPEYHPTLKDMDEDIHVIKKRLVDTASSLVTTNDDLVGSVEGLQCIVLEGIYHSNTGNLRRAWVIYRRAIVVAQLMGMHRPSPPAPAALAAKFLDPAGSKCDPRHMWFRIVFADRFISLMIGLPGGCSDTSFTSDAAMDGDHPMGRLERLHAAVAMRVLERNERLQREDCFALTQDIDLELQRVSRSSGIPPQWWLSPRLGAESSAAAGGSSSSTEGLFLDTMRLVHQSFHYNLLNQLHLPYMLRHSAERRYDYSKAACVSASREQLGRFVSFRGVNLVAFSCRSLDFFAFMASMTLCLAHLESHRGAGAGPGAGRCNPLGHQRPTDRGMMERVLGSFEDMHELNGDALSQETGAVLRKLLEIEADAAEGGRYSTDTVNEAAAGAQEGGCGVRLEDHSLTLSIPYFGTVRVAREGVSRAGEGAAHSQQRRRRALRPQNRAEPLGSRAPGRRPPVGSAGGDAPGAAWGAPSAQFPDHLLQASSSAAALPAPGSVRGGGSPPAADQDQFYVPGLTAEADDWAFQGVDMAFFDNLMGGQGEATWSSWDTPVDQAAPKDPFGST